MWETADNKILNETGKRGALIGKTTQVISESVSLPSEYKYLDYKPIVRKEWE